MGKIVAIALIAAIVGGAAIYGLMLYLGAAPLSLRAVTDRVEQDLREPAAEPLISETRPDEITDPTIAATALPTHITRATPTGTTRAVPTDTPTATPAVLISLERETVVHAFASCGGQYAGADRDFRARAADAAIAEGRQTVADIRGLVEEHCGGGLPDSTPVAASGRDRPTPPTTPTAMPARSATAPPTPTMAPPDENAVSPHLRHIEAKQFMLDLINSERRRAGVEPVTLGDNIAAQLHADSSLENCTSSHWGVDGLKPYMRYSLAGGYQSNGENGSGLDYCIKGSDNYRANSGIQGEIREAMTSWMGSPGHRRNILNPEHKMVNIGLAWDRYNTAMYQHFEGDYVTYDRLPTIEKGVLSFSGATKGGIRLSQPRDLGVQIHYDPPPKALNPGQLARTYCYDLGRRVAGLRQPLSGGYFWTTNEFTTTYDPCPDPNDVAPETPAPRSPNEAHQAWRQAYAASQSTQPQTITVPWITASQWTANGTQFAVTADISGILRRHGNGVYSLLIWGGNDGGRLIISQYSIFHGVTPPSTYDTAASN